MPNTTWTLTDVSQGIFLNEFAVSPQETAAFPDAADWFPGNSAWSVVRQVLRGGVSDGVDVIHVNNGRLSFSILPTRGMGLWKGTCDGLPIGWQSPVRNPVHPCYVNQLERGGIGWLNGFNEWLCRCGLDANGPPGKDVLVNNEGRATEALLTLHGKIANTPAHRVDVQILPAKPGKIRVTGIVDETMMFGPALRLTSTVETTPGSNQLTVIDEVTNLRGTPAELELLYHINLGPPFLEGGASLVAPVKELAPRDPQATAGLAEYASYGAPDAGFAEQVYLFDLAANAREESAVLLRNFHGDKGFSLHFNKRELPCFTQWKCTQAEADGYVTGLEPGTNYPNLKTFEREHGRVINLKPGESYRAQLEMRIHSTAEAVARQEELIAGIQQTHTPKIYPGPHKKYSASGG